MRISRRLVVSAGLVWLGAMAGSLAAPAVGLNPAVVVLGALAVAILYLVGDLVVTLVLRHARIRRAEAAQGAGTAQWMRDHDWSAGCSTVTGLRRALRGAPTVVWQFVGMAGSLPASATMAPNFPWIAAIGTIALGLCVCWFVYRTHEILWFGTTRVFFPGAPFRPGETMRVAFAVDEGGGTFHDLTYRLERIEEHPGEPLSIKAEAYLTHTVEGTLPADRNPPAGGDGVELDIAVPEGAGGTRLAARFPHYWELEIRGTTDKGSYAERFLVPIYAESGSGEGP